ncbi:succinyl-diaminopimelate desuccinylase [Apilactobacillus ozensis DSM 23829 = JCM 17196]|uniref:Probable succinyl-diaminopimelate desuccinylase n=1 Tax=Apilactobacillus ozensis DSM 23829 = JCM 17196 TaxID=1423781 RepID=A0A0R2AKN5_9LACO|nr:ArgE/DapE family deacylase [Apilactobacillus ozensis]KRM67565.1 succinyl-diaminopimelate desuccinylase [Apilactobacillus ozensis DSM 23829 = JCM 17196]
MKGLLITNNQERISILEKTVSINTENNNEEQLANYLQDLLNQHGIKSEKLPFAPNRSNLITSIGSNESKSILALTGHMDTVNSGEISAWKNNPFKLTEINDKLFGRGTSDMKSGLIAIVIALIELHDEKISIPGQVRLIATGGEEKGQLGAADLLGRGLIQDIESLIVAEPSRLSNPTGGKETQFAIFAQNGVLDYEIVSHGKSAHSSMPNLGINAIDNLNYYLNQQKQYFDDLMKHDDKVLGKIVPVNSMITGGEQINSVPEYAKLTAKIRTTKLYDADKIISDLKALIDKINQLPNMNLEFKLLRKLSPVITNTNSKIINLVSKYTPEFFDQKITLRTVAGTTDAATFVSENQHMNIVQVGPGNESSHMVNEYVNKSAFINYIDFIKKIIVEYFKN